VLCVGLFSEEGIIQKLVAKVGQAESARLQALAQEGLAPGCPEERVDEEAIALHLHIEEGETETETDDPSDEEREKRKKGQEKKEEKAKKESKQQSLLQAKLTRMALFIGCAGTFFAVLIVIILLMRFTITKYGVNNEALESGDWSTMLGFLIVGVTVLVVVVPEGLPLAVT